MRKSIKMEVDIVDLFSTIKEMVKEPFITKMEATMKVSGKIMP